MRAPTCRWPFAAITILSIGCMLAACTQSLPVTTGLKPIFPPAENGWPSITSTQPTLRWEVLRLNGEAGQSRSEDGTISNPRYDLKIWREKNGRPVELVYERRNLEKNAHKLVHPLQPKSRYFWTVRARFDLNGKQRVSPWSRIGPRQKIGVVKVPGRSYLRFETPPADNKTSHENSRP